MNKTIKTIKIYQRKTSLFNKKLSEAETDEFLYETYDFDKEGRLLLSKTYAGDGTLEEQKSNKYDEKGNLVSEEIFTASIDTVQKRTFEYKEFSNSVVEKIFFDDENFTKKITAYDEGRITKIEIFEDGNTLSGIEKFNYDENYNVTEHSVFDGGNVFLAKDIYEYDQNNVLLSEKHFEGDTLTECVIYEYDESGRLVQSEKFIDDISQEVKQFEYDNIGNVIKEITFAGDTVIHDVKYKYDKNNNCIETEENNRLYGIRRFIKKVFDDDSNLTEEIYSGTDNYINRMEYTFYHDI